jgi:hypothetical protein
LQTYIRILEFKGVWKKILELVIKESERANPYKTNYCKTLLRAASVSGILTRDPSVFDWLL